MIDPATGTEASGNVITGTTSSSITRSSESLGLDGANAFLSRMIDIRVSENSPPLV
jgi:hypothetical protein